MKGKFVRKFALSGLVALAAVAGMTVPVAAGSASAAVMPSAARSAAPAMPSAGAASGMNGFRISCGTSKTCFAVGSNTNSSTGNTTPVALAWNGTKWKSVAVHAPKGTSFQGLTGVSCKSATYCLVTGTDLVAGASGTFRPFALVWNGTAISAAPLPPVPAGATDTELSGVTCVAVKSCVAGGVSLGTTRAIKLVFETWNGAKWALHTQTPPVGTAFVAGADVSCASLSYCVLGGVTSAGTGASVTIRPYLAAWNGKTATAMKVPVPSGAKTSMIMGVSCATTSSCVATGVNIGTVTSGTTPNIAAFTEIWNGKAWTLVKPAGLTSQLSVLEDVSCTYSKTAGTHCVAVGAAGTANTSAAVAETWNGKAWSRLQVPGPGAGKSAAFEGVSCLSARQCTAIGEAGPTTASSGTPLAGFWTGSAWKLMAA